MKKFKNNSPDLIDNYHQQYGGQAADVAVQKSKKPIYKKWWFIVIAVIIVLGAIGAMGGEDAPALDSQSLANEKQDEDSATINDEASANTASIEAGQETVENTDQVQPTSNEPILTMGQKNALNAAYNYLDYTAFSYKSLVEQLEYEGYSNADAVFAVDRCGADWNDQAAKSAANYLDYSSFSRQGLIDQLLYEGFSTEQATYAVAAVGY